MTTPEMIAMICILGAIACFIIEMVRSWFSALAMGLTLLSIFFLLAFAIPTLQS